MRAGSILVSSVLLLAVLSGCYGPQLQYPRGSQVQLEAELEAQRAASFKRMLEIYERLTRISTSLRLRAAPLCGQEVLPLVGVIVLDQRIVSKENRDVARRLFNLTNEDARVMSVIADTPAAKGGLQAGDIITRVDGARISFSDFSGKSPTQFVMELFDKAGSRQIPITIERKGKTQDLMIVPQMACRYPIKLTRDKTLNAYSDGEGVIMPHEMVNFTDDEELAFVLSHEIAHNLLGHIKRREANAATGAVIGAIFDIGLAAAGVNTQGLGARTGADAGRKAYSQEFEYEADYLGLYLMAQAGFDTSKAISFFRKMGIEKPQGMKSDFLSTHPSYPERATSIQATRQEIEGKIVANVALAPERIRDPGQPQNPPPALATSTAVSAVPPQSIAAPAPAAPAVVTSIQPTSATPKPTIIYASLVQFDGPKIKYGVTLDAVLSDDGNGNGTGRIAYPGNSNVLNGRYKSVSPGVTEELKILDAQSAKKLGLKNDLPWSAGVFSGADTVLECIFGTTMPLDQKKGTCKDNYGNRYDLVF